MKNKVFSVFLCAVLCFGILLTSLPRVASASAGAVLGGLFCDYVISKLYGLEEGCVDTTLGLLKDNAEAKKELYLVSLRNFRISNNIERSDYLQILQDFYLDWYAYDTIDTSVMSNRYGSDWEEAYSIIHIPILNFQVPSEDLKIELEKQNETISPKNRLYKKYSYREQSTLLKNRNVGLRNFARNVVVGDRTCVDTSLEDGFYIQMYYYDGTSFYYLPYQYHMYRKVSNPVGPFQDPKDSFLEIYTWYTDPIYYKTFDGVSLDTFEFKNFEFREHYPVIGHDSATGDIYGDLVNYDLQYLALGNGFDTSAGFGNAIASYSSVGDMYEGFSPSYSYSKFWNRMNPPRPIEGASDFYNSHWGYYLKSDDASSSSSYFDVCRHFTDASRHMDVTIDLHDSSCSQNCDFGYLISAEPFSTTFQFDTSRLPANSTVTITNTNHSSGDTTNTTNSVYDYSITDNSTGDTTTIYNYVTNNYAFPPKEETSEPTTSETSKPSGSGNVGGNVTVGGTVKVDGQINVSIPDINININQNGGNGGAGESLGDYIDIDTSEIDDDFSHYLGLIPKLPKSFIDYMKDFFSWLPKEIYGLLIFGLLVVVIQLVLRRR